MIRLLLQFSAIDVLVFKIFQVLLTFKRRRKSFRVITSTRELLDTHVQVVECVLLAITSSSPIICLGPFLDTGIEVYYTLVLRMRILGFFVCNGDIDRFLGQRTYVF